MSENAEEYPLLEDRDFLEETDDIEVHVVPVPEWKRSVRLKVLTAAERDKFEASTVKVTGGRQRMNLDNLRARLVSLCMVNTKGERIVQSGDVERLGKKSSAAVDRLFSKCQEINGFSEKDIEDLTEDFGETSD